MHRMVARGTRAKSARSVGYWCLTAGIVVAGCSDGSSGAAAPSQRPPTPVHVERVTATAFDDALVVPGIVEPNARIALGFRIDGFLARFAVDEGDHVEAGTILAELDLADLQREVRIARAAVEQANARAAEAKLLYTRQQELMNSGNTSAQALDRARLTWEATRAAAANAGLGLESAKDRLGKGTLRAPVTGYIERRLAEPYEAARAGEPVLTLTILDPLTVRAAVADVDIARLHVGQSVTITAAAAQDYRATGTITRIDVSADSVTRTCPFEVSLPNPDMTLRPELVVEVHVVTGRTAPLRTVPLTAVLRDAAAEPFCFVIATGDTPERAARRPVVLGAVRATRIIVVDGLQDGDRVVTRGQHFLSDGDPVRVLSP